MLGDEFATSFTAKIDTLHNDLLVKKKALNDSAKCVTDEVLTMSSTKFSTFTEMKLDDIRELAATVFSKSCVLDPLPSSIIKQCTDVLLPTITNIVNLSLREGWMPTCLKSAVLSPLLKKPDTDFLQFKNFRPILKLKALSKIIEKSVALQLNNNFTICWTITYMRTFSQPIKYIIPLKLSWWRYKMIFCTQLTAIKPLYYLC